MVLGWGGGGTTHGIFQTYLCVVFALQSLHQPWIGYSPIDCYDTYFCVKMAFKSNFPRFNSLF